MKRILILLGRYKPNMSPNSICMDNIIKLLPKEHYDITCISYEDFLKSSEDSVHLYKISRGLLHSLLYRIEKKRTFFSSILRQCVKFFVKVKMLPFLLVWPYTDPIYTKRVKKLAYSLHVNNPFDIVIAVHMPLSSLIVGRHMKIKFPSIMFVAYFLDSLSGGRPLRRFSQEWILKKKLQWEKKLLDNADKIVVMESSREHHKKHSAGQTFFSRMTYLDIPLLTKKWPTDSKNPFDSSKINILFCGAANHPMRNMTNFCLVAKALSHTDIAFTVLGDTNFPEIKQSPNITYIHPLEHELLFQYYEHADILINFGVRTPSAISGKIFEYMSYGKPIISTYSIDNEACLPYLQSYPISLALDERESISSQADQLYTFARENKEKKVAFQEIQQLFYKNSPQAFVEHVFGSSDNESH